MKTFIALIAPSIFCIIFIVTGCSDKSAINIPTGSPEIGVVLSGGHTDLVVDYKGLIATTLNYNEYDEEKGCFIIKEPESRCVNIDQTVLSRENGVNFIYALENGTMLDENMEKITAHAYLGTLKFYKFELLNDKNLKIVAESETEGCGPFGSPCSGDTYKVGNGPELGWVVSTGDMHQGYAGSSLSAYAVFNKKIASILTVQTSFSDAGAFRDDVPGATVTEMSTRITTLPSGSEKFYDLEVVVRDEQRAPIFSTILKFDSKTNTYDSKAVAKIYEGLEY